MKRQTYPGNMHMVPCRRRDTVGPTGSTATLNVNGIRHTVSIFSDEADRARARI